MISRAGLMAGEVGYGVVDSTHSENELDFLKGKYYLFDVLLGLKLRVFSWI